MKTNKKVQKNSVQKSEKETAIKVTALAIIPKPMTLLTPQDVPTATEVTEAPETATVPTVTEEAPQQAIPCPSPLWWTTLPRNWWMSPTV